MRTRYAIAITAAAWLMAWGQGVTAQDLRLSNKWRIEVSESAKSDGTLKFAVTPKDGQPVEVSVPIKDGRGENGVAQDIRKAFSETLDSKAFHAEVDDGEDVLVKRRKGPDFEVKLVESTVEAVRITIERE